MQSDKQRYIDAFEKMILIRRFEEKSGQLYGMGKIAGFCHLYIGQEAVITGMLQAAQKDDKHVTSYRDHGHILALGMDPKKVMAELMGKASGCSKGKGGSMHLFDLDNHFYGGHGIVGAQVPIGTGIAFADRYKKNKNVTFVYYGDGAAHQGQIYESFNLAKLWNLPVVYIIENNEYAMGTSVSRSTYEVDLYKRGISFGIPGEQVDGMDFFEVEKLAKKATKHTRSGKGPFIIEAKTYRYRGHSMSDPATYRTKEEVTEFKEKKDPINILKKSLLKQKYVSEEELLSIEKNIKAIMKEVVAFSEKSPEPDIDELYTDVYAEMSNG